MKHTTWVALAAGLLVAAGSMENAAAQGRGIERDWDRDERFEIRRDRDRDWDRNRRREEWEDRRRARELEEILRRRRYEDDHRYRHNAPPFCRNGRGHPVHGRAWCREKGYGLGDHDIWRRVTWGNVVYRRPRSIHDGRLSRATLADILGAVLIGRFDAHRRYLGYREPLYGHWHDRGTMLQVTSGAFPIAQVIDRNRDGRADAILLLDAR